MIDINNYQFYFFDFDGVIVDSLDIKRQAFGELFQSYGKEVVKKVMDFHVNNGGVSRYDKFKYYYANFLNKDIDQETISDLDRRFSMIVENKVINAAYVGGVMEFIGNIHKKNKTIFIVSATPQEEIRRIVKLKNIDRFFKEVLGSPQSKTRNIEAILRKYAIDVRKAIYFGDAKSDLAAACDNAIDFVGVVNNCSCELKGISGINTIKDFSREVLNA
jgi:beta-phosphoglucomutase-like phosphatase (HAD superfamily)